MTGYCSSNSSGSIWTCPGSAHLKLVNGAVLYCCSRFGFVRALKQIGTRVYKQTGCDQSESTVGFVASSADCACLLACVVQRKVKVFVDLQLRPGLQGMFFFLEMHVDHCLRASSSADAYNSPCPLISSTSNIAHSAVCSL